MNPRPSHLLPLALRGAPTRRSAGARARAGFSLMEILVAIGLLAVIILGLLAMFDQTQKAFRLSMTQTDVLQTGRALQDMLTREMEQISPSGVSNVVNLYIGQPGPVVPQDLPGMPSGETRPNVTERVYFLTRFNQRWQAIDYAVVPDALNSGAGTLYRYVSNSIITVVPQPAPFFTNNFAAGPANRPSRVADGIVHFVVRAYDANGALLASPLNTNGVVIAAGPLPDTPVCQFTGDALPAAVEVEFGILEPQVLDRLRSMPPASASQFLKQQAGKVHVFRQRITLPNAQSAVVP